MLNVLGCVHRRSAEPCHIACWMLCTLCDACPSKPQEFHAAEGATKLSIWSAIAESADNAKIICTGQQRHCLPAQFHTLQGTSGCCCHTKLICYASRTSCLPTSLMHVPALRLFAMADCVAWMTGCSKQQIQQCSALFVAGCNPSRPLLGGAGGGQG